MKTLINLTFVVIVGYIILTSGFDGLAAIVAYLFAAFSEAIAPHVTETLLEGAVQ